MISFHKATKGCTNMPWGFVPFQNRHARDLWDVISQYTWSPIVFARNYRLGDNFVFSDICGLDFDNKMENGEEEYTIKRAMRDLGGLKYMIATTKSHQLPKNTEPPRDRFRVLIPFERRIDDPLDYQVTMRHYVHDVLPDADQAGVDLGRQFYPCKELVHIEADGEALPVIAATKHDRQVEICKSRMAAYAQRPGAPLPRHVVDFLSDGKVFGKGRNDSLYVSAQYLVRQGLTKDQVLKKLTDSPFCRTDFNDKEFLDCVKSAFRKKQSQ